MQDCSSRKGSHQGTVFDCIFAGRRLNPQRHLAPAICSRPIEQEKKNHENMNIPLIRLYIPPPTEAEKIIINSR